MSIQMRGAEVAKAMKEKLIREREELNAAGVNPCLTIIRVGAKENDLAYERGAKKRMEMIGIECRIAELPEDISQEEFEDAFCKINKDPEVHGILLFQPLPEQLDVEKIRQMIDPAKDMDGMSPVNLAKIFEGDRTAYAPCTSEAVMHIMNHYGIELQGKRVTVIGRSMVVGKPLSMLMLGQNATVTICHSRTKDLADRCREAEIIVAAIGRAKHITADMIAEGAVVADVGINVLEDGTLCGGLRKCPGKSIPYHTGSGRSRKRHNLCTRLSRAACRPYRSERTRTTQRVTPPLCRTQYKWAKNSYNR